MDRPGPAFLLDDYLLYLPGQGRQPATIKSKRHRVTIFLGWLQAEVGRPPGLDDLTSGTYRAFMQYLQDAKFGQHHGHIATRADRPLSPYTIRGYAKAIKAFSRWLAREGHCQLDPLRHD